MPPLALAAGVLSFVLEQLRPHTREGELGAQAAFALALWAYSGFWSMRRAENRQSRRMALAQPVDMPPGWTQTDWTAVRMPPAGYSFLELGTVPVPRFIHPSPIQRQLSARRTRHDLTGRYGGLSSSS